MKRKRRGLVKEEKKPIRLKGASIFFVNKKHWRTSDFSIFQGPDFGPPDPTRGAGHKTRLS